MLKDDQNFKNLSYLTQRIEAVHRPSINKQIITIMRGSQHLMHSPFAGLFLLLTVSLIGCDVFQDDTTPKGDELLLIEPSRVTPPGTPLILDLKNAIQAEGNLDFIIETQPLRGTLDFLEFGILKYSPNADFTAGTDLFAVAVYQGSELLDVDTTVVEVSENMAMTPCIAPTMYGFFEVPLNGIFQFSPWLNESVCADSATLGGISGAGPANGTISFANRENGIDYVYIPNPGFTGLDSYTYYMTLTDLAGNIVETTVLVEFAVEGSEDFLPVACEDVWPNQLLVFDTRPDSTYEVQVEFPSDACSLPEYTVEIVSATNGTAEFADGKITFRAQFSGGFNVIEYIINFANGDALRRQLQLAIDNTPG